MARVIRRGGARVLHVPPLSPGGGERERAEILVAMRAIESERRALRESAAAEIGALALEVAGRVVGERVAADPALLERLVLRALARARHESAVTVQLHPADRASLEAVLAPRGGVPAGIALMDAPDQARGGCVVRGASVTIDARVETALAAIAQAMGVDAPELGER